MTTQACTVHKSSVLLRSCGSLLLFMICKQTSCHKGADEVPDCMPLMFTSVMYRLFYVIVSDSKCFVVYFCGLVQLDLTHIVHFFSLIDACEAFGKSRWLHNYLWYHSQTKLNNSVCIFEGYSEYSPMECLIHSCGLAYSHPVWCVPSCFH